MVAQNTLRICEGKQVFYKKINFDAVVDVNKSLKQIGSSNSFNTLSTLI